MAEGTFVALVQNAAMLLAMALVYDIVVGSRRTPSAWVRGLSSESWSGSSASSSW